MKYIESSLAKNCEKIYNNKLYGYSCLYLIIPEMVFLSFDETWYSILLHAYLSSNLLIYILSYGPKYVINSLTGFHGWINIIAFIVGWSFIMQNSAWAKFRGIRCIHLFTIGHLSRAFTTFTGVKKTYKMIYALLDTFFSIPVFVMLLLWGCIIYIYSTILYSLLNAEFPILFTNIGISYITVSKFCLGAGWNDAIEIINYNNLYFILFSTLSLLNFGIMNSLIGIYVTAFSDTLHIDIDVDE